MDRRTGTPLWLQRRLLLKRQIEDGVLPPGQRLPSEAELCERFSISLYETIRQRYGLVPFRAERWIEAAVPDHHEAGLLGVSASAPVLGIESIAWLQSGLPMEYYYALHRTDHTRLHVVSR
jgi:DNA-binding GntR family transcriptional regulator